MVETKTKKEDSKKKVNKAYTFNDLRERLRKEDSFRYQNLEIIGKLLAKKSRMGISKKKLSSKTGIPKKTISAIFDGTERPSYKTLSRLAEALEMEIVVKDKVDTI